MRDSAMRVLSAVLFVGIAFSPVAARTMLQIPDVAVNVRNTFAAGDENDVGQKVDVVVPGAQVQEEEPTDFTPRHAMKTDAYNPECSAGHEEQYVKQQFNTVPIKDVTGDKQQFYVSPDAEIQPVVVMTLNPKKRKGEATVVGDGLDAKEVKVEKKKSLTRTVCGEWVHNNNGLYDFNINADDVNVWIQYYARPRKTSQTVAKANGSLRPDVNVAFQMDQTVVGSSNAVKSNAYVDPHDGLPGAVTFTIRNAIKGSDNEAKQFVESGKKQN